MPDRSDSSITFYRDARSVRHARLWISNFVMALSEQRNLASEMAMAAAELVENAVRHGTGPRMVLRLQTAPEGPLFRVRIEVENDAAPEQLALIARLVQARQRDGPEDYARLLKPAAGGGTAGGVGLARVQHEARMTLTAEVRGARLRLVAERRAALEQA